MRFRRLGRTGLDISELTLGTSALAAAAQSDVAEAGAMVALALDRGINAIEIDAGDGAAAALLGEILKRENARDRVHILVRATSLVAFDLPSPHVPVQDAYPGRHLRAETEALLVTLGVERLALQQLHAWCPEWQHEGDWLETLERLHAEGKIAGFGVSLFDHDAAAGFEIVASERIDSLQAMYNVFDPGPARALLPLCQKHDVGVIARAPLYYGALGGRLDLLPEDWRRAYFFDEHRSETRERVERLKTMTPPDQSVADMALRFCLSHPAVSTVAVGMRNRAQLEANLRAVLAGPLDADTLTSLATHAWLC
jgi:aryl-alcohol dehydrogenase-like predicted oxidoreductase